MVKRLLTAIAIAALCLPVAALAQEGTAAAAAPSLTAEAQLCTGVQDRMPTGMSESFVPEVGQVYIWCKITGSSGESSIKVVWSHQGQEVATVDLPVKSSSWRTWSSKKIMPHQTGDWGVKIMDASGNVLKELNFKIEAPAPKQ